MEKDGEGPGERPEVSIVRARLRAIGDTREGVGAMLRFRI